MAIYKSGGGAPMVKIKDFTLASQNLGALDPRALHIGRPLLWLCESKFQVVSGYLTRLVPKRNTEFRVLHNKEYMNGNI